MSAYRLTPALDREMATALAGAFPGRRTSVCFGLMPGTDWHEIVLRVGKQVYRDAFSFWELGSGAPDKIRVAFYRGLAALRESL